MKVAFRVDASQQIGIGHLIRCMALSEELIRKGHICFFISKIESEELIRKIKEKNIIFQKINSNFDLKKDREALIEFVMENKIDWIITDSYEIDKQYNKYIKEKNFKVLSIDDTAQIYYYSDIVLNQNIGAEKLSFLAEKYTKFLLGSKYIMLRDQLLKKDKKIIKKQVNKILIMLGGGDENNNILKIIKMLEEVSEKVEFLVIIGPFCPFENDIKNFIKEKKLNVKLIKSPEDLSDIYLESDIAISAGGSSCYELAYFGIPNIIITLADNQLKIANELDKQKISINVRSISKITKNQLKNKVNELINNDSLRNSMIKNGKKLVDGKGKVRIVDFMERYN